MAKKTKRLSAYQRFLQASPEEQAKIAKARTTIRQDVLEAIGARGIDKVRDEFEEARIVARELNDGTPYTAVAEVPGLVWVTTFEGTYAFEGVTEATWRGTFYEGAPSMEACNGREGDELQTRISNALEPEDVACELVDFILRHRRSL